MESKLAASGPLLDAQVDLIGRRLATASADGVVRVWSGSGTNGGVRDLQQELRAHRAAAVSVSWGASHSARAAGNLASGSIDGHVVVWREGPGGDGHWNLSHQVHVPGKVGALAFSPPLDPAVAGGGGNMGGSPLMLAVAGADDLGIITMYVRRETAQSGVNSGEQWSQIASFPAHTGGATSLSWAPSASPATLASGPAVARASTVPVQRRFASGGLDGLVCVWQSNTKAIGSWHKQHEIDVCTEVGSTRGPSGNAVIRDVAFRPSAGLPGGTLACCTADGHVGIWIQEADGQIWNLRSSWKVDGDARRLAWSQGGVVLSVSVGEGESCLYREVKSNCWERIMPE